MKLRVALNGFGKAGQGLLDQIYSTELSEHFEVAAINEQELASSCMHDLFFNHRSNKKARYHIACTTDELRINHRAIPYLSLLNENKLPWKALDIDIVVESSQSASQYFLAQQHLNFGASQVLDAAPPWPTRNLWVEGLNDDRFSKHNSVIEQASAVSRAVAPVISILTNHFEFDRCHIEHLQKAEQHNFYFSSQTCDQSVRAALPTNLTNISLPQPLPELAELKAIFPELSHSLSGRAIQCELKNHSLAMLTFELLEPVKQNQIQSIIKSAVNARFSSMIGLQPNDIGKHQASGKMKSCYVALNRLLVVGSQLRIPIIFEDNYDATKLFRFAASLKNRLNRSSQVG